MRNFRFLIFDLRAAVADSWLRSFLVSLNQKSKIKNQKYS